MVSCLVLKHNAFYCMDMTLLFLILCDDDVARFSLRMRVIFFLVLFSDVYKQKNAFRKVIIYGSIESSRKNDACVSNFFSFSFLAIVGVSSSSRLFVHPSPL